MYKRILTSMLAVVLCFNCFGTPSIQAKNLMQEEVIFSSEELERYSQKFDELEESLANKRITKNDSLNVNTNKSVPNYSQVITTTLEEDNALVTLGIIYSENNNTYSTRGSSGYDKTSTITHAKVYMRMEISEETDSTGRKLVSITHIEGQVLALYDGATLEKK